ncbi:hypothetical protein [Ectopseudomonas khazarica]|uniref:hypothetical protein n=1 Tax=Ectopseudomonas khazarica TaxID=2502979 RepID=UPI002FDF6DC2
MDAPYLLAVIYIYVPVMWGLLSNHATRHGYSHVSTIVYAFKLNRILPRDERTMYLLAIVFALFLPLSLYVIFIDNTNEPVASAAICTLLLACILAASSFFTSPAVRGIYGKHKILLNSVVIIAGAINYSRATSYAEGAIVYLTGLRASELPTAMSWLSIIMVPLAWVTMLAIGFVALYSMALFGAAAKSTNKGPLTSPLNQVHIKSTTSKEHTRLYSLAFCCAILGLTPITLTSLLLKTDWAEIQIRKQLVSASFHVNPEACSLPQIEDAKIALLEAGKAIIAIPDQALGYKFRLTQCPKNWITPEELLQVQSIAPMTK